jgi:hypothetical protein
LQIGVCRRQGHLSTTLTINHFSGFNCLRSDTKIHQLLCIFSWSAYSDIVICSLQISSWLSSIATWSEFCRVLLLQIIHGMDLEIKGASQFPIYIQFQGFPATTFVHSISLKDAAIRFYLRIVQTCFSRWFKWCAGVYFSLRESLLILLPSPCCILC